MVEDHVRLTVESLAEEQGWGVWRIVFYRKNGCPDTMFIKGGRVVFIEFKDRGKVVTVLQSKVIKSMRSFGAEVHANVDTVEKACRILKLRPC